MEVETVQNYSYEQFLQQNEMGNTDLDLVPGELPEELKKDNRAFWIAGLTSILAGIGFLVGLNVNLGTEDFFPLLAAAGIGALGYGAIRIFRRVFRRKKLNLPSLQVRRKTERVNATSTDTRMVETFRSGNRLTKSLRHKVIMGVCGGIAEHSGLSPALVRMLFLGAFALSGGVAVVVYMILAFALPDGRR